MEKLEDELIQITPDEELDDFWTEAEVYLLKDDEEVWLATDGYWSESYGPQCALEYAEETLIKQNIADEYNDEGWGVVAQVRIYSSSRDGAPLLEGEKTTYRGSRGWPN